MKKRCETCRRVSDVAPRARRCKLGRLGRPGVCCWGRLRPVVRKRAVVTEEHKLAHAHIELGRAIARAKRNMTSVTLWQRRIRYYEDRIDARDHPRPPRPKPVKKLRAIAIETGEHT